MFILRIYSSIHLNNFHQNKIKVLVFNLNSLKEFFLYFLILRAKTLCLFDIYNDLDISSLNLIFLNPNRAEIFSHLIHAGGGGSYLTSLLSPVIAVIKGQTKKQMIKFCKKTNFEQFFNSFYSYLTVKPPKTVIYINASGRCIFYSINLKFYEKARFCICDKI